MTELERQPADEDSVPDSARLVVALALLALLSWIAGARDHEEPARISQAASAELPR